MRWSVSLLLLAAASPLQPPLSSACVSSPFGPRALAVPGAGHAHPGIDLPAAAGTPVYAAAAGRVTAIRRRGLGGLWIELAHADGLSTLYAHLGRVTPRLALGAGTVGAGEMLGRVGRSGFGTGAHLYFAARRDGVPFDPVPLLSLPRC